MSAARAGNHSNDNNHAVTAVLTDQTLVNRIAELQSGYPHAVATMVRSASEVQLYRARGDPRRSQKILEGALPRLAVAMGDSRALTLLFELKSKAKYRDDPLLQFVDTMRLAVQLRRVDMLDCLAELKNRDPTWQWEPYLLSNAVGNCGGDVRVHEWLYTHLPPDMRNLSAWFMGSAMHRGVFNEIRWLVDHGCPVQASEVDAAVLRRRVDVLAYLYQHTNARCSEQAVERAVSRGDMEIVKLVVRRQTKESYERSMDTAVSHGRLEMVQYFVENAIGVTTRDLLGKAASGGHLAIVKYLLKNITGGCTSRAMDLAASCGHLDIVEFLHENRIEGCTAAAMDGAAAHGHLEIVKFLHGNRSEGCTRKAMDGAAKNNHLDVVKFLHEHRGEGCTMKAMNDAAARGHLEIVKFLHWHRNEG